MIPRIDFKDLELHVQHCAGSDKVEINYRDNGKLHAIEREISEPLEKTLIRISRNFQKKEKKKKKGPSSPTKKFASNNVGVGGLDTALLCRADGCLAYDLAELTNGHWETGMRVLIKEDLALTVVLNAPVILSIGIFPKKYARVNNFLVPLTTQEFTSGIQFAWYAKSEAVASDYEIVSEDEIFCPEAELVDCSLKLYCTPFRDDADPMSDAPTRVYGRTVVQYLSKQLLPEIDLPKVLECRHQFLQDSASITTAVASPCTTPSPLRLVSFNILARAYAQSSYALSTMYDYIENQDMHLSDEYRLQLVAKELLGYRGDIMCLQEVDESAYHKYLNPILSRHGYLSHHTTKNGTTVEGCATFVSSNTFNVLHTIDLSFRDVFASQSAIVGSYLHTLCGYKPDVHEILTKKITTIAQISILSYKHDPHHLCLAVNTHLFYHPDAAYIRLLQIHEIMERVDLVKTSILAFNGQENAESKLQLYINSLTISAKEQHRDGVKSSLSPLDDVHNEDDGFERVLSTSELGGAEDTLINKADFEVSCLVFGDLNATPNSAAMQYLERCVILPSHKSWSSFELFTWGKNGGNDHSTPPAHTSTISTPHDEDSRDVQEILPCLSHQFKLKSAAGYPRYTNYTKDFKNLLDYIFVEKEKYEVVSVAPFPSEEVLSANCAIPSEVFPSDHLALVVDVQLVST